MRFFGVHVDDLLRPRQSFFVLVLRPVGLHNRLSGGKIVARDREPEFDASALAGETRRANDVRGDATSLEVNLDLA